MVRKKSFKAPKVVYVIFDAESGHILDTYDNPASYDYPGPTEVMMKYYLPKKRTPKSKEI